MSNFSFNTTKPLDHDDENSPSSSQCLPQRPHSQQSLSGSSSSTGSSLDTSQHFILLPPQSVSGMNDPSPTSRGSPYVSSMLCRSHIRRSGGLLSPEGVLKPPMDRSDGIRQGSLYQQLRSQGITDEVAFTRQRMFNRLSVIVRSCDHDDHV